MTERIVVRDGDGLTPREGGRIEGKRYSHIATDPDGTVVLREWTAEDESRAAELTRLRAEKEATRPAKKTALERIAELEAQVATLKAVK